jgi:PHD/YefM family antitoxin component YafN of YafNO toxin-antitoxin module
METVTFNSFEARGRWRDMMDAALTGKQVVIARYDKPQAVLVNYEQWQMFQQAFLAMLQEQSREAAEGNYVLFEDVMSDLKAQGILE